MRSITTTGYKLWTTRFGDTFDALALGFYGDEKLAHLIIEANLDYADVLIFEDSADLLIPVISESSTPDTLPPWRRGS